MNVSVSEWRGNLSWNHSCPTRWLLGQTAVFPCDPNLSYKQSKWIRFLFWTFSMCVQFRTVEMQSSETLIQPCFASYQSEKLRIPFSPVKALSAWYDRNPSWIMSLDICVWTVLVQFYCEKCPWMFSSSQMLGSISPVRETRCIPLKRIVWQCR